MKKSRRLPFLLAASVLAAPLSAEGRGFGDAGFQFTIEREPGLDLFAREPERPGEAQRPSARRVATWVSLGAGTVGALGAWLSYLLGNRVRAEYDDAVDTDTAMKSWERLELYRSTLSISAAVGAVGFGLSSLFYFAGPKLGSPRRAVERP